MERREEWYQGNPDSYINSHRVYHEGRLVATTSTPSDAADLARVLNQHAALVEQRDRLMAALREIQQYRNTSMICLDSDDDTELETEYRKGARAAADNVAVLATRALASIPQPNEPQAKGGSGSGD